MQHSHDYKEISLVDSHCHLNMLDWKKNKESLLKQAEYHHIKHMLTVNVNPLELDQLLEISSQYSSIFCSVGLHPNNTNDYKNALNTADWQQILYDKLVTSVDNSKVIALGETGLDYYYEKSEKKDQQDAFNIHLKASVEKDVPVIIHTRDADADTIQMIKGFQESRGVFHCFSGDLAFAREALDLGYMISFSGIITFKNAESLRGVVKYVPLDRMLVETDSPYLAPVPKRGKENQPAHTLHIAEKVAEVKGVLLCEVAEQTTKNFFQLFNKAASAAA